ncbi:hypothetical protein [Paenibacillus cineris]|uniref:Uncharacterized protein n=1 Tax=Paenibacillus cineris TaxID=237530 RepID=A0ABQ4LN74_9BACL|nr:hypothetical protein [Paenibacillus cineris]GIO57966.1 hypothetical protein J21TS7_62840 [Paenibacillus cineris]
MKQITARHLTFLQIAINVFETDVLRETHWNTDRDLVALRYGTDRDCIQIFELGEEVGFFSQMIPPTDGEKYLEALGGKYDLEFDEVRSEVEDFAFEMEHELRNNDYKGGWENSTPQFLKNRLERNLRKLFSCVSHAEFRRRCANIANYAMMLSDNDRREEAERAKQP